MIFAHFSKRTISQIVPALVLLVWIIPLFDLCVTAQETLPSSSTEPKPKAVQQHTAEVRIWGEQTMYVEVVQLDDVTFGIGQHVSLFVRNESAVPLVFKNVATGCNCTTAKVPQTTLQPGDGAKLEFAFEPQKVRDLGRKLTATVDCEGATKKLHLQFEMKYIDIAAFDVEDAVFYVTPTTLESEFMEFYVPLRLSDPTLRNRLKLNASQELRIKDVEAVEREGKCFVRLRMQTKDFSTKGTVGTLSLTSPYKTAFEDKIVCRILLEQSVTISPSLITFVRDPAQNGRYVGNAILKVASQGSGEKALRKDAPIPEVEVVSQPDDSATHDFEVHALANDFYRLKWYLVLGKDRSKNGTAKTTLVVDTLEEICEVPVSALFPK